MSHVRVLQCCACLLVLGAADTVRAQSMDPSTATLALHRPFQLHLPVRTDLTGLTGARLSRCIEADFQSGSTLLFSDQMKVSLQAAGRDGWQLLVFEHPHVVREAQLMAHVVLHCPARLEREFAVEAQAAPAALAAMAPATLEPSTAAAPSAPIATTARPSASSGVRARTLALTGPSTSTATALEAQRLRDEVKRLHAALQTSQLSAAPQRTADAHATVTTKSAAPAVPATAEPGPRNGATRLLDDLPEHSPLLGLAGGLCLLVPLLRWWRRRPRLPKLALMEVAQPDASATPTADARPPSAACVILEERPETVDLIPPTVIPQGAASLADRDAARFVHQVAGLVHEGYHTVAVDLLEKTLTAGPARNPWLMLQLLELHEQQGQSDRAARLISELQTLYRVQLPTVRGMVLAGQPLLEQPALLRQIEQHWASAEVVELLEDLIYRVPGPTWDLATFRDLLLLHAVARDRTASIEAASEPHEKAAFEPVLEWTVEEP